MKQITSLSHMNSQTRDSRPMDSKAMDFHSATGKLEYTLTNDYLFKYLLQRNRKVLKALVASLMHYKMEDITSIEITNPIELGRSVKDKIIWQPKRTKNITLTNGRRYLRPPHGRK